jgi:hypothetical protein
MPACPFSDTEVSVPGQAGPERASAGRHLNGAPAHCLVEIGLRPRNGFAMANAGELQAAIFGEASAAGGLIDAAIHRRATGRAAKVEIGKGNMPRCGLSRVGGKYGQAGRKQRTGESEGR